jgi:hypothetical protein
VGYLGQFNYNISKNLEVSGGIDLRYSEGRHYQRIEDLLGGDYYINDADKNAASPMKHVGDKIAKNQFNADRSGLVQWTGAFGQVEYSGDKWSYFINLSGIVNGYKGIDYFQKRTLDLGDTVIQVGANDSINFNGQAISISNAPGLKYVSTDWKFLPGFTFKSGISYKVNKLSNVYMNLGFLNRTPQFSNVIDNNTNTFFGEILNFG